jgi:hypothetical protein
VDDERVWPVGLNVFSVWDFVAPVLLCRLTDTHLCEESLDVELRKYIEQGIGRNATATEQKLPEE